jgi:hypothetical protein
VQSPIFGKIFSEIRGQSTFFGKFGVRTSLLGERDSAISPAILCRSLQFRGAADEINPTINGPKMCSDPEFRT